MKLVFFLVALANVALFMWEYNKSAVEQATENAETVDYPVQESIVLAGELNTEPTTRDQTVRIAEIANDQNSDADLRQIRSEKEKIADLANESRQPPLFSKDGPKMSLAGGALEKAKKSLAASHIEESSEGPQSCFEAGPFPDKKLLDIWNKQLLAVKAKVQFQTRMGQSVSDYLVYQPSAETPEQSNANLQKLKSQGFTDAWTLKQSDVKGGIVLGVFKKEERALVMKEQLQTRGIYVEVMPRYKKQSQKYVLIKGGRQVQGDLIILEKNYPSISVKSVTSCLEP
ncbi:MAG: hypothetical protein ACXWUC_00985 [Methylosarcina sp.]